MNRTARLAALPILPASSVPSRSAWPARTAPLSHRLPKNASANRCTASAPV